MAKKNKGTFSYLEAQEMLESMSCSMTKETIGISDIKIKYSFHGAKFWIGIVLTFLCLIGCILSHVTYTDNTGTG